MTTEAWFYDHGEFTHCWALVDEEQEADFFYHLADRGPRSYSVAPDLTIRLVRNGFTQSVYQSSPDGWRTQHFD